MNEKKKIGMWAIVMITFTSTFGFRGMVNNVVVLGPSAIISWIAVSVMYFLPLTLIIAELASGNDKKGGGLYSWLECGLGSKWAFAGTWSYFAANLFFLQYMFASLPIVVSWALFGENRFTDENTSLLIYMSLIVLLV